MRIEIEMEWAERAMRVKGMKDAMDAAWKGKKESDLTIGEKCLKEEPTRALAELGAYVAEQIDRERHL